MGRTIIISNRLPVKAAKNKEGAITFTPSEGGLATGLGSIYKKGDNLWIGWPGLFSENNDEQALLTEGLRKENMLPVFLSEEEIKLYYEGFSNETLWPTFHYFTQYALYRKSYWQSYEKVNQKFCEALLAVAQPDDTIWIHDYQLMLLPLLIRQQLPDIGIGFFLHIPFPSYEVFRLLPWRKQLIEGVLGADLVGFHTHDDMRHFLSAASRICFVSNMHGEIEIDNRKVVIDSFPISIDYDKYESSSLSPETKLIQEEHRKSIGDQKIMLSIDRLDYSKGIPARLQIFDLFFEKYPEWVGKVSLMMIVVPSRDTVEKYKDLKEEVDLLVGRINGKYGTKGWMPIHYFYRSFSLEELSAFYRIADVALVTPMRDGMNLVCKEYVASKTDKKGVLILSEMAGASKELSEALIVNPNDKHQVRDAIFAALNMPEDQQEKHMRIMQDTIRKYDIHHWVKIFFDRLYAIQNGKGEMATNLLLKKGYDKIADEYSNSRSPVLFLDYDGTLVPFANSPEEARPDAALHSIIKTIAEQSKTRLIIISGRDRNTLQEWLGHHDVEFVAEHGVWYRGKNKEWEMMVNLNNSWKQHIRPILEEYVDRTPKSSVEEKDYSLAWHYRKVDSGLGELRAREIISHLKYLSVNMNLQVLEGNKVVEIKSVEVSKGKAVAKLIEDFWDGFSMAIGDDETDEDMFRAMPDTSYTIKVGDLNSEARLRLKNYKEVRALLTRLAK
ncbi:MAG: bifunctional alpha,alpha-trehalose-phosphate synthase (UDP-forming)/trehalose-phosphatase, partial [Cyclobacteriaceae bacterium]|nr:bifunctional alpha,alpha-trehalose-phosphate synthase (UDP-forming)/trehalose-phosphatase [Cyclobacteriaceae bacterium]